MNKNTHPVFSKAAIEQAKLNPKKPVNLKTPTAQATVKRVLQLCNELDPETPIQVHSKRIREAYGNTSRALGKLLFELTLKRAGLYVVGEKSTAYVTNEAGIERLKQLSGIFEVDEPEPDEELKTLTFKYNTKSYRDYNGKQNIPSKKKTKFWAKYLPDNFDAKTAAPNLLSQLSLRHGLSEKNPVFDYTKRPKFYRRHVSRITGCSLKNSKKLINSLFNIAKIGCNYRWPSFLLLKHDHAAMKTFMNDPLIQNLRAGIKEMWEVLGKALNKNFLARSGGGALRWELYRKLEREVMEVVYSFLRAKKIPFFKEHDGFRTNRGDEIDPFELQQIIFSETKFNLPFEREKIEEDLGGFKLPAYVVPGFAQEKIEEDLGGFKLPAYVVPGFAQEEIVQAEQVNQLTIREKMAHRRFNLAAGVQYDYRL